MNRKSFLKSVPVIGATGGFVLTGCSTGTGNEVEDLSGDLAILTQAAEREAIAVQTYTATASLIQTQAVIDTAAYYRSHHQEHLTLFNELIVELNGDAVLLEQASADPRASETNDEESAVRLAMTLELEAAQAYLDDAVINLTGNRARLLMGRIYPVELSHFVTLNTALGVSPNITGATFSEIFSEFNGVN